MIMQFDWIGHPSCIRPGFRRGGANAEGDKGAFLPLTSQAKIPITPPSPTSFPPLPDYAKDSCSGL